MDVGYTLGGDAFVDRQSGGMTLRDYFAGQAIRLFSMSEREVDKLLNGAPPLHDVVAQFCYDLADAMLDAREET